MENGKNYSFQIDESNHRLIIKRVYPAPLDQVWDAFTKAELLDQWWAPKPWKSKTKSQDFKEGGKWLYAMQGPDGEQVWSVSEYLQIEPKRSFQVMDAFTDETGKVDTTQAGSIWQNSFKEVENGTEVSNSISFNSLADMQAYLEMGFKEGYEMGQQNLIDWLNDNKNK